MASSKAIEAAAAAWFAKRDRGDWSRQDQAELDAWLARDTANRVAFLRIEAAWNRAERMKALAAGLPRGDAPTVGGWTASPFFEPRPAPAPIRRRAKAWPGRRIAAAAALALLLGGGAAFAVYANRTPTLEYATAVGGRATVPLTDGSLMTLNTNSEVKVALSSRRRTVRLPHGEAFFEVRKDPSRPFVVEAASKRIIAVGTKFSVRSEGAVMQVSVTEGRVRIEEKSRPGPGALLEPGDIGVLDGDTFSIRKRPLDLLEEDLSWREGFIVLNERPLGEAVQELNRYNATKVVVADPRLADIKIGGRFRVTNVDAFLRLLERGLPVRAVRTPDAIVLEHTS